jgi:sigma-B regulation protein RsbU (phosphoserine phosphatase)
VNAGHNAPLLIHVSGEVEPLEAGGMVLGMFDSVPYDEGVVEMKSGDTLVIFSDGVSETFDNAGDEFGAARLIQVARDGRELSASAVQDAILAELDRFAAGAKITDDRTTIVLKRG